MLKPLHDRVLIQPSEAPTLSAGGLHIPDAAKERPIEGKVIAVGPGKRRDDNGELIPMSVAAGAVVVFSKYSGTEVLVNGERMLVIAEGELLGVRSA